MKRIVLLGFAVLLFMGALAGATPAETTDQLAAAIFSAETPGCPDLVGTPEPELVQEPYWTCGSCSVSACQGLGPGAYCGKSATGYNKYCQAGAACTGEGDLNRRCFCIVIE